MVLNRRQNEMLTMMKQNGSIVIKDAAARFGVSIITIRRDLDDLIQEGMAQKVYGGATLAPDTTSDTGYLPYFYARAERHRHEKELIGAAAAALVGEGDTIVLDVGTTALEVAKNLGDYHQVTVLSASLMALMELSKKNLIVYALGGQLRQSDLALIGGTAYDTLSSFCIDKAFIGAGGVTFENGMTDYNRDSAELCMTISRGAKQVILVTDSSKFGQDVSFRIGMLDMVSTIVTDRGIPKDYIEKFQKRGIEVIVADE